MSEPDSAWPCQGHRSGVSISLARRSTQALGSWSVRDLLMPEVHGKERVNKGTTRVCHSEARLCMPLSGFSPSMSPLCANRRILLILANAMLWIRMRPFRTPRVETRSRIAVNCCKSWQDSALCRDSPPHYGGTRHSTATCQDTVGQQVTARYSLGAFHHGTLPFARAGFVIKSLVISEHFVRTQQP